MPVKLLQNWYQNAFSWLEWFLDIIWDTRWGKNRMKCWSDISYKLDKLVHGIHSNVHITCKNSWHGSRCAMFNIGTAFQ